MSSEFELPQEPDTGQYVSASVNTILRHLGEHTIPPELAPARGAPALGPDGGARASLG